MNDNLVSLCVASCLLSQAPFFLSFGNETWFFRVKKIKITSMAIYLLVTLWIGAGSRFYYSAFRFMCKIVPLHTIRTISKKKKITVQKCRPGRTHFFAFILRPYGELLKITFAPLVLRSIRGKWEHGMQSRRLAKMNLWDLVILFD